ncbi:Ig-like domain repeat protein [Solicola gregarius]|uniref:Ig-like domain repeat protein n=1 Tax=Solicola gregarius TaxID=2908642 RepID=A0AA46TE39_9ACTN|nr:Ig-like domain repeat protein [Solicola gregarius]UYM03336.1 Ig-like domain repeat protein [Solicola gregarius]
MRAYHRLRRGLLACAMSAALVAGSTALTTTTADGAPAAPIADDVSVSDPVHRPASGYPNPTSVELQASGGNGALTYHIVDQPSVDGAVHGTATIDGNVATIEMKASAPIETPATFTYKAVDADGAESNVATVSFEVSDILPLTRNLHFSTEQDTPLDIWPFARDAENGGPFFWGVPEHRVTYGDPAHGTVQPFFNEGDDLPQFATVAHKATYVPDAGYTGEDSFTYTAADRDGESTTKTVTVDVTEPAQRARGEVSDIRYRCAYHVKTNESGQVDPDGEYNESTTKLIDRVMGGDVAFRIDVRAKAPKTLAPGEKYTVPDQEIDLKMPQGMAELLAGDDIASGNVPLETAGFGQTAVGGQATSDVHFTETATGNEYDVPLTGLKSKMMPMSLPVPSAGVTIPVKGALPELTAPQSGKVVVSMPEEFFIDSILDPGVLGGAIKYVGLRCYAFPGEDLKVVSSKVVQQAATTTTATAPKVAYGQPAKVNVRVSGQAKGKVSVFKGKKRLGTAKLAKGKATIKLGRTALKPGKHKLQVKFAGSTRFKASKAKATLRVTKARSTVRATKVGPKKVVAKKTRAKVRVNVRAADLRPGGKVTIRSGGKVIGKGSVRKGALTLRVQKFAKPGKKKLVVRYAGSSTVKAGSDRLSIRVVRRR